MLILGITNPAGEKRYICAAFPSACGKTNLAMLMPSLPGWKVETIGDDIAWLRFDKDGRMRAINPENGFFGVAPGTSDATNPNAMATFATNSLFTNVGVTDDGDVYWEGMDAVPDAAVTDWKGNTGWKPSFKPNGKVDTKTNPAAHPNSRFTAPLSQCPILDDAWDSPEGVPIDAIIFGGRRDDTQPLVYESFGWDHGTFLGATMRSNATKAADQSGLVHDPMAMIPFIGYNIKDYFGNWLRMRRIGDDAAPAGRSAHMPRVFHVNWFGKGEDGEFLWPGFSENCRVLDWILERCAGRAAVTETAIGFVPAKGAINLEGLKGFDEADLERLLHVDQEKWKAEASAIRRYFTETLMKGDDKPMPPALMKQLEQLEHRIAAMEASS
jgi:phosphoenolpyruvate carboxykinase (GTP)